MAPSGWAYARTDNATSDSKRAPSSTPSAGDLPRFRPYDLRHTHASLLIDLDAHPKAISERMGHSEMGVTMNVYGHPFQDKQEKLTNDLDALVERTRQPGRPDPSTVAITRSK